MGGPLGPAACQPSSCSVKDSVSMEDGRDRAGNPIFPLAYVHMYPHTHMHTHAHTRERKVGERNKGFQAGKSKTNNVPINSSFKIFYGMNMLSVTYILKLRIKSPW